MELVQYKNIDRALRKQEKKNLKQCGSSLSWVSMENKLGAEQWIECLRTDEGVAEMKDGWRDFVRTL